MEGFEFLMDGLLVLREHVGELDDLPGDQPPDEDDGRTEQQDDHGGSEQGGWKCRALQA